MQTKKFDLVSKDSAIEDKDLVEEYLSMPWTLAEFFHFHPMISTSSSDFLMRKISFLPALFLESLVIDCFPGSPGRHGCKIELIMEVFSVLPVIRGEQLHTVFHLGPPLNLDLKYFVAFRDKSIRKVKTSLRLFGYV